MATEANPLYPVSVLMRAEELESIYEELLEESKPIKADVGSCSFLYLRKATY